MLQVQCAAITNFKGFRAAIPACCFLVVEGRRHCNDVFADIAYFLATVSSNYCARVFIKSSYFLACSHNVICSLVNLDVRSRPSASSAYALPFLACCTSIGL